MAYQTFTVNQQLTSTQMNTLQESVFITPKNQQSGTTYTLLATDAGKLLEFTNNGAITLTIPTAASVAFDIGTSISILKAGTGTVTLVGASGVTINSLNTDNTVSKQWEIGILTKRDSDGWVLSSFEDVIDSSVTTAKLADSAVTSAKIADGTIVNADVNASAAIDLGKLADATIDEKSASYTLALTDKNKFIKMSITSTANTVTVPTNASVAFPIGSQIHIIQYGTGKTQVIPVSGTVTLYATPGAYLRAQYSAATLLKCDTNIWMLMGDLSAS